MEIRQNIINAEIDFQALEKRFDFYLIETDLKKKPSARLLDEPAVNGKIIAVQYTSGNSFIAMLKKSEDNKSIIKKIIEKHNDEHNKCLKAKPLDLPFEKKYEHLLLQILFNSLAKRSKDNYSNLGGRLFYFCESIQLDKIERKQVVCIELHISKHNVFSLDVVTFTNAQNDTKGKKYVLQANNTFRPKTDNDNDEVYTISQLNKMKNVVPFLETAKSEKLEKSKIGILNRILNKFNKEYGEFVKITFATDLDWKKIVPDASITTKKHHLELLKTVFKGKKIVIVDTIESDASKHLSQKIVKNLNNFFDKNTKVTIRETMSTTDFNIRIIHDKNYYEINKEEKDNHKVFSDRVVQHITIEDFSMKNSDSLTANCLVVLNELLVKYDLLTTHKISLTEWSYDKDWTFCLDTDENESDEMKAFMFMRIKPDGSFVINTMSKDLFNQNEYNNIDEFFKSGKKCRGLIINENGEMNIIQDTDLFMLPNFEKISSDIPDDKSLSRSQQVVEDYFAGCIDIHYKEDDNVGYYSSGVISKGMNTKIENATHIRKITPTENSPLFFGKIIETMNVTFVRNGQLTVLPFPFKYLREYAKMVEKEN